MRMKHLLQLIHLDIVNYNVIIKFYFSLNMSSEGTIAERRGVIGGTLIHCEAFYDTDTHRIVLHVPEELKPKDNEPVEPRKRGRPILYSSDEERKAKHREQALSCP